MEHQQTFSSGNSKYYVTVQNGCLVVQRQDWIERTFIGFARDMAEARALIRHDAKSNSLIAA
jgi:hypothetical protein